MRIDIIAFAALSFFSASSATAVDCYHNLPYLSSTSDVYAYLEGQQFLIYEGNPELVNDPYLRERLKQPNAIQTLEQVIEEFSQMGCDQNGANCLIDHTTAELVRAAVKCDQLPTRYESPLTYALLKMSIERLAAAKSKAYPGTAEVRFGTMPTGTINAMATVFPGTSVPIVILNRDVFHFTGKFSKAVSAAIPIERKGGQVGLSYDKSTIRQRIKENPWILDDFIQAMFFLVTNGSPIKAHETQLVVSA